MKIKRKKVGDRTYELIDTEVGDVVARVSMTGRYGVDHYPWDWHLTDDTVEFGDSGMRTQGVTETLKGAIDFIEVNANRYGLTYRKELHDRAIKREQAIARAKAEDLEGVGNVKVDRREIEGTFKPVSALTKMVRKLDSRNKRTSRGYVTNRDELIAILSEVSRLVSVSIVEEERPYSVQHKEISVTITLGLTLERELL